MHFIGTQGVGKSTLLRAILFFYNADKAKLGIAKEKKGFDEFYFPFQNSYIIYEVAKETGFFCIMAFKSAGRVAFRFFDAAYDKSFFIDKEGKAFETWDKTREVFGKHINHTKIITSYEEYRNIISIKNNIIGDRFYYIMYIILLRIEFGQEALFRCLPILPINRIDSLNVRLILD